MTNAHNNSSARSCRSMRARVSEAVDGRLGRTDAVEFQQHLLACPACRAEHDRLVQLQQLTHSLQDEPIRDDFRERLLARIEAGEGASPEVLQHPHAFAQRVKFFASGAATAAALLISLWLVIDGLNERAEGTRNDIAIASPGSESPATIAAPIPVNALRNVDANRLGFEALQRSQEFYDGLREQATRVVSHPPKFAMEKLAEKSRALIDSIRFLEVIDGTVLELPTDLRSKYRSAATKAEFVLATARQESASRDSVQRVVNQILRDIPSLRSGARSIKIRLQTPGVDIRRILAGRTKSTDEMHRYLIYAWKHLAPRAVRMTDGNGNATFRVEILEPGMLRRER